MGLKYKIIMLVTGLLGVRCTEHSKPEKVVSKTSFYNLKTKTITGETFDFSQLKGKKVLIVNTASKCGFTPQFDELEELHEKYKDKLVILGFPCNQFGGQDPGNNKEIGEFCRINYGVTFQMMDKVDVKGENQSLVYKWLSDTTQNGWNTEVPGWNFGKYLIDENGELLHFYGSSVSPLNKQIVDLVK